MSTANSPEPWLRGPIEGVHALVMPVFFSFGQVREDLMKCAAGLSEEAVWRQVEGASLGFHLRHIAGSVDRLTTYLMGGQLGPRQLEELKHESEPHGSASELVTAVNQQLARSEEQLRQLDPATLYDARSVGRRALPTTVLGLIVHLCEHTQRHLGQAITLAKMLRQR